MPRSVRVVLLRVGVGLAACGALLLAAAAAVFYRPDLLRPLVLRALTPAGGSASVTRLSLSLRPPAVTLEGLRTAGPRPEDDVLAVDRVAAVFEPRRLLGAGPWIARLEARGLTFERRRPSPARGPVDLTPLTWVFRVRELDAVGVRVTYALSGGQVRVEGLRLSLAPEGHGNRRFRGRAAASFARGPSLALGGELTADGVISAGPTLDAAVSIAGGRLSLPTVSGAVSGRGALRLTKKRLEARELELGLSGGLLRGVGGEARPLGPARLHAAGGVGLEGRDPRLELALLELPGTLRARGALAGPSAEELAGTFEGDLPEASRAWPLLASRLRSKLPVTAVDGALAFRCRLGSRRGTRTVGLELFPRSLGVELPGWGLHGRLDGWVRAGGPAEAWSHGRVPVDGRLDLLGRWRRGELEVSAFRLAAPVAGELSAPSFPHATLSAAPRGVRYGGRPLPLGRVEASVEGLRRPDGLLLRGLEISSETLGRVTGELAFGRAGTRGTLEGRGLGFAPLLALGGSLRAADWTRWSTNGAVDVTVRLEPSAGETAIAASAGLRGIGFSSPAGDVMGQNLGGRLAVQLRTGPALRLSGELASTGGEALWGTAYADLAQAPVALRFGATRARADDYRDVVVEGTLGGFGRVLLTGEAGRAGGEWRRGGRLVLKEAELGRLFEAFVRDPLAPSHPALAGLEAAGTGEADLSFSGRGKTADVRGRISVRSGTLHRKDGAPLITGLDVELPVSYALGRTAPAGGPSASAERPSGRLRVRQVRVGDGSAGPLDLPIALVPNRLVVGGRVDLPLYGGRLSLKELGVAEPLSPGFEAEAAASLEGLDLRRLPLESALLEGRLGGELSGVRLTREALSSTGTLSGELLGGRVEIRDPAVVRPFSPARELGADVRLTLLDLERLSDALRVGRITGRASGSVAGLRIAYGQPVAFHLRFESVPVKGVSQRVSLKAVNSISVLGTGSALGGFGLTLLTTFFREFPYAHIGVESTLRNDVFTVRGLIREHGVEYLVKRPLFAGINVVNQNPDNRISFADMVDRLKRVTGKKQ